MKQDDSCGKKERTARKVSAARERAAEKKKSMEVRILAIGDVVGEKGLAFVQRHLRPLKKEKNVDFVVVNGENAAGGLGLLPDQADGLFAAGADVITLGNHDRYDKRQIAAHAGGQPLSAASGQLHGPRAGVRHGAVRLRALQHPGHQSAGAGEPEL